MKQLLILFLLIPILNFAQKKNCEYSFEEKTDSTYIKALSEKIIYEKIFGNSREFIQFNLINNNGIPTVSFQQIQKNQDFIPARCFDKRSKIIFQLENGKIVTLISTNENICSSLTYIQEEKSNIRLLTAYFIFSRNNYEELKKSRITIMRIQYAGETKDYIVNDEIQSEILNTTIKPSNYFIDYLSCIDEQ